MKFSGIVFLNIIFLPHFFLLSFWQSHYVHTGELDFAPLVPVVLSILFLVLYFSVSQTVFKFVPFSKQCFYTQVFTMSGTVREKLCNYNIVFLLIYFEYFTYSIHFPQATAPILSRDSIAMLEK